MRQRCLPNVRLQHVVHYQTIDASEVRKPTFLYVLASRDGPEDSLFLTSRLGPAVISRLRVGGVMEITQRSRRFTLIQQVRASSGRRWPWLLATGHEEIEEPTMPRMLSTLTLSDAKRMLDAAEAKATSLGIPYNIAVVDVGGALIAFARQDGALEGSIDLAIGKAKTAQMFNKTTEYLAELAQPGAPLFGIGQSNGGRVVIFGGGLPVTIDHQIVGAVGTSAGSVEQDIAVAEAAAAVMATDPKA
jgi:uncharacterized protein GlcG (DUF336 family)